MNQVTPERRVRDRAYSRLGIWAVVHRLAKDREKGDDANNPFPALNRPKITGGKVNQMKITRRQFNAGLLVGAVGAGQLTGCNQTGSGKNTVAVLFDGLYSPFWVAGFEAIKADLARRGFHVAEAISDQNDAKQLEQVKSMIARGVSGIVIVQTDGNAVIPAIQAANKAGIPMVHFNRAPSESDHFSVAVQADNRKITNATVEHMVKVARQQAGKYQAAILIGHLGDVNAIARRDGFFDIVDQHPDVIEVVSRIPTDWNADQAYGGLTNALQANPGINFLFTSSDFLFPQVVQAMKNADKFHPVGHPGHVIFGGFDGDATAYKLLKDKVLDADGVQDLEFEAKLCVDAIVDMQAGKLAPVPGETNPKLLNDPGFAIHQDNLQEMQDRMWGFKVWSQQQAQA